MIFSTIFSKLIRLLTHHGGLAETIATEFHLGADWEKEGFTRILIPMLIQIPILNNIQRKLIQIL